MKDIAETVRDTYTITSVALPADASPEVVTVVTAMVLRELLDYAYTRDL